MVSKSFKASLFRSGWAFSNKSNGLLNISASLRWGDIDSTEKTFLYNWFFPVSHTKTTLIEDYQLRDPSALVSFYQVDLTTLDGPILYFTNERNELGQNPTWQGQVYTAIPIEVKGFELRGNGQFPRPTLKLSNYAALMSGLAKQYQDLVGVKFTRKRTRLKYIDAVNFAEGNVSSDPNTYYPNDIYYVDRKITEGKLYVEWELASALDISGIMLPRRQIIQNTCTWKYRSAECSYAGGDVADTHDVASDLPDVCGKRLNSCKLRFVGSSAVLPYGGFPGASMT